MKGIIYKVENKNNGYVYVGATTKSIEERKKDHLYKAQIGQGNIFQEAISTYGTDAFNWETIDTASSTDELAQKEKQYILEYNSKKKGYNIDAGGGFKKTVYQYDLKDGKLVGQFETLQEAGQVIKTTKQHISRACLSVNKTYGGFYWSYEYLEPFKPNKDARKNKVMYYNLKEDSVQEFDSIADASRITGISKSCVARFCKGDRTPPIGFKWFKQ